MSIPDFQSLMLPILKIFSDGQSHKLKELVKDISVQFELTPEECKELLPSGRQPIIYNRAGWAVTYLRKAQLLRSEKRGVYSITERGLQVLSEYPERIDIRYLKQFDEVVEFISAPQREKSDEEIPETLSSTPEEALESAYQELRESLALELLEKVKESSPEFFEYLVIDLLVGMGYGGSRKDAGERVGKSGDEGIDGIIKEDRLGLDVIYIQAKRWEKSVGRPDVQGFVGALQGKRARKGVFITTSHFTKDAEEYAASIDSKVILIDGRSLARFMIDYNVGVSRLNTYEVKQMDTDYFDEI